MSEAGRLLLEAQAGSREALERLVREQAGRLYTIALRITQDRHFAEDVVQEAFLRLITGRATLRKAAAAESWLARVVSGLAIDQLRLNASRRRREVLLQGVPEGTYELFAAKKGLSGAKVPRVASGSKGIGVQLGVDVALKGRVLDARDGSPVEAAEVGWEGSPRDQAVRTNAQGSFEIAGGLEEPGSDPVVLVVRHPDYANERARIPRERIETSDALDVSVVPHQAIEGRVVDAQGRAVSGARVRALPAGCPEVALALFPDGWPGTVSSRDDGRFTVKVPRSVSDSPGAAVEIEASHTAFVTSHSGPIPMGAGQGAARVEIVLTEGSTLEGRVTDAAGRAVAGAAVKAVRCD